MGIILTISEGGVLKASYVYDSLNQLTRANDAVANKTYVYTYDNGGNILSKKEYAYTTGALGAVLSTVPYTYSNANWKDQLTAWNGQSFTYDAIGNPLTYRDGMSFTWQNGRQLATANVNSVAMSFTYDDSGIRQSKTVGGVTTNYITENGTILAQTTGANSIYFEYDETGKPFRMEYGGVYYYYLYNAQNDVVKLVNSAGTEVVNYTYDSWGVCTSVTGTLAGTVGAANPWRYRGYYFDESSGLYYVESRYYDPVTMRFINADKQLNLKDGFVGFNLFAYCTNNPVNYSDPCGTCLHHIWFWKDCATCAQMKSAYISPNLPLGMRINLSFAKATVAIVNTGTTITAVTTVVAAVGASVAAGAPIVASSATAAKVASSATAAKAASASTAAAPVVPKVVEVIQNNIINLERVGSALKPDVYHSFSNIVDNYAGYATQTALNNATLYQLQGALNGVAGRFEWIVQAGQVTHRMFVAGGGMNGIPIMP